MQVWDKEHEKVWLAMSRIRTMYKPNNHTKAQVIYDTLNDASLLRPNEEEMVIAVIVSEFLEWENDLTSMGLGQTAKIVNRLKEINAL